MPSEFSFALATILAALSVPFASQLTQILALPCVHILLAAMGLPIMLMCFGISLRALLVFYYVPWKFTRELKKKVYVDMDTKPDLSAVLKRRRVTSKQRSAPIEKIASIGKE